MIITSLLDTVQIFNANPSYTIDLILHLMKSAKHKQVVPPMYRRK